MRQNRSPLYKTPCNPAFIEFKKYQKEMSMYIKPTSNTSKANLMINNGVYSEEFERMKDVPLK